MPFCEAHIPHGKNSNFLHINNEEPTFVDKGAALMVGGPLAGHCIDIPDRMSEWPADLGDGRTTIYKRVQPVDAASKLTLDSPVFLWEMSGSDHQQSCP